MKPMVLLPCLAFAALEAGGAMAVPPNDQPESVTIPLDRIWAFQMPGTRNIEDLDTKKPLVFEIRRAIGFPTRDKDATPGFAVLGEGLAALREAHAVFVGGKKPHDTFPERSSISVVFFAHETGPYVHLHNVELRGSNINIYYRFVPHEEEVTTRYIAMIPFGKLPIGKYLVRVIRLPMEQKYLDIGFRPVSDAVSRRIVCHSFSFKVSEQEVNDDSRE